MTKKNQHTEPYRGSVVIFMRIFTGALFVLGFIFINTFQLNEIAQAGSNSYDFTFGTSGKVKLRLSNRSEYAFAIATQTDGKIVVAGGDTWGEFVLARLNTNGSLDTSFDTDGVVTTVIDSGSRAQAVAIQSDGKIVVAGFSQFGTNRFALARYNTDGSLDNTFDNDGKVTVPIGNISVSNSVALQPDGKIVVAGYSTSVDVNNSVIALVRLNANGSLDNSFDSDGIITTPVGNSSNANVVRIQADSKIIVGGRSTVSATNFTLIRYNYDGTLDTSFDSDGIAINSVQGGGVIYAVDIQPNNKIVAAGWSGGSNFNDFTLARYNTDGSLDSSFGNGGIVRTAMGNENDYAFGVKIQADGKIVAAGYIPTSPGYFAVARYNANGTLDNSFDSDGKVVIPNGIGQALAIQNDGKIVVAGYIFDNTTFDDDISIIRFMGDPHVLLENNSGIAPSDRGVSSPPGVPASNYPSTINVTGMSGSISKVRVTLKNITHTNPRDLDVLLVSPQGQRTIVMSDSLGDSSGVNSLTIYFDQSGASALPDTNSLNGNGFYIPTNLQNDTATDPPVTDIFPAPGPGAAEYGMANLDVFNGTNPNGTWSLYVVDDANGGTGSIGGWNLEISTTTQTPNINSQVADFDGDKRTDLSIYRPSNGQWWYLQTTDNAQRAQTLGAATDKLVPGDYDGDGKTDVAVFRPSTGQWLLVKSSNAAYLTTISFGIDTDIPTPGDFDGDTKTDIAVYRPSTGTWWILNSSGGVSIVQFGIESDIPEVADYDGDGKADICIYRPNGASGHGEWWMLRSTEGFFATPFGSATDKPIPGDYTGDGKADVAFWRPSTSDWFVLRSEDLTYYAAPYGLPGDIPAPGDYDGDGRFDFAVFRPTNSTWYVSISSGGTYVQTFGTSGDKPVPAAYNP